MTLQKIEVALMAPGLERDWRDTLAEWTDATPEQAAMVLRRIFSLRNEFLQAARDIADPETLEMVTAIHYIELKCHWIMLNTQVNYRTVFKEETDMSLAYQASLVSQLLEALERLIDEDDVDRIIQFLAEPVALKAA